MTGNEVGIVLIAVIAVIGIIAILVQGSRLSGDGANHRTLVQRARHTLRSGSDAEQHTAVHELLHAFERSVFRGVRGAGYYAQLVFLGGVLVGTLWLLVWGIAGAIDDYHIHHAAPCKSGAHRNCLFRVAGIVTGKDVAGRDNDLYVTAGRTTYALAIFGDIHPVQLGEHVTIERWNGTWVYVLTLSGLLETNDYPLRLMYGLIFGILFPPASVAGMIYLRWSRKQYLAFKQALEEFEAHAAEPTREPISPAPGRGSAPRS